MTFCTGTVRHGFPVILGAIYLSMKTLLLLVLVGVSLQSASAQVPATPRAGLNLWRASITTLAAANALDMHSSWGKRELNPMLAGSTGRFGSEGALFKLGLHGGLLGIEYLITRGRPSGKIYRAFSYINFGAAASTTAVAMRNYSVSRPR